MMNVFILPVERRAILCPKKFLIFSNLVFRFLPKTVRCNGVRQKPYDAPLQLNIHSSDTLPGPGESLSRTKVRQDPPAAYGISGT